MAKHEQLRLKKGLGQHFLHDQTVLLNMVEHITARLADNFLVEIGPGAGALSQHLRHVSDYKLIELDRRWAAFLPDKYPELKGKILNEDILKMDLKQISEGQIAVVGNFPYNISTEILFKVLDNKAQVPWMIGMFQKEVAARVCAPHGSRTYGITSVLLQCFYETTYLFDVLPESFNPPPKVVSGVMLMERKENYTLPCDYKLLKSVVKAAFNQRRKMMRSSLKSFITPAIKDLEIFSKRPEQMSVDAFINLTNIIESNRV